MSTCLHGLITNNTFPPGPAEEQPYRCSAQPPASSRAAPLPQPPFRPESGEGSGRLYGQVNQTNDDNKEAILGRLVSPHSSQTL